MDNTRYYNEEEQKGRRRKHREALEASNNITDFEIYILQFAYDAGGDRELRRVYEHYKKNGYEPLSASRTKHGQEDEKSSTNKSKP